MIQSDQEQMGSLFFFTLDFAIFATKEKANMGEMKVYGNK